MTSTPPSSESDKAAASAGAKTSAPARKVGFKFWLYASLAALATGGAGYLIGAARGHLALKACESERAAEADTHQETSAQLNDETKHLQQRIRRLAARRTLHRALMALEERNFGIAKDTLAQAGKELESATNDDELKSVARRIASFSVDVTADIGAQRDALIVLTKSVDERLDESTASK